MRIIRGRKALVTGAAAGIGRALALALAREGADLFLIDIDAEKLEAVACEARAHGVAAIADVCDLADGQEISAAVKRLVAAWGGLDILINNAGVTYYGPTEVMSAAHWRRIISINLLAPAQLFAELLPLLARPRKPMCSTSAACSASRRGARPRPTRPASTGWSGSRRRCGPNSSASISASRRSVPAS